MEGKGQISDRDFGSRKRKRTPTFCIEPIHSGRIQNLLMTHELKPRLQRGSSKSRITGAAGARKARTSN